MKCAMCERQLSFDDPVFLLRQDDEFLVFCSSCEGSAKDSDMFRVWSKVKINVKNNKNDNKNGCKTRQSELIYRQRNQRRL